MATRVDLSSLDSMSQLASRRKELDLSLCLHPLSDGYRIKCVASLHLEDPRSISNDMPCEGILYCEAFLAGLERRMTHKHVVIRYGAENSSITGCLTIRSAP